MLKNIIANYIGRIWGLISVFVFVPFYIKLLGFESYAIINFYTVILTLMFFADAGLSATLSREMARSNDKQYLCNLLFTIERLYLIICSVIALGIFLGSGSIAANWLHADSFSQADLRNFITLMGVSVALQLFTTLQSSGLMGMQKQVLANKLQVAWSFFRYGVVLVPLYFYSSLYTYFIWQLLINSIFFFIIRYQLWRLIKTDSKYVFSKDIIKTVGRFAIGMMAMAIISSLNTQIDKLLTSKILTLTQFGYYSLSGIISQSPIIVITPIALAILPQMTKYSDQKQSGELTNLFHQYSFVIATVTCSIALVLFLFTKEFTFLWTHSQIIAENTNYTTKILLIGCVFLAFQYMPYHLAIANGHTQSNIRIGVISVACIIPALIVLINKFGLIGASIPWLVMNFIGFIYLGYFLIRKFLKGEFKSWFLENTLVPLVTCIFIGILAYLCTRQLPKGFFVILYSMVIGSVCIIVNSYIYNKLNPKNKFNITQIIRDARSTATIVNNNPD